MLQLKAKREVIHFFILKCISSALKILRGALQKHHFRPENPFLSSDIDIVLQPPNLKMAKPISFEIYRNIIEAVAKQGLRIETVRSSTSITLIFKSLGYDLGRNASFPRDVQLIFPLLQEKEEHLLFCGIQTKKKIVRCFFLGLHILGLHCVLV